MVTVHITPLKNPPRFMSLFDFFFIQSLFSSIYRFVFGLSMMAAALLFYLLIKPPSDKFCTSLVFCQVAFVSSFYAFYIVLFFPPNSQ